MSVLIALLRGLNVGGRRRARMEDLVSACESIGGRDVRTYVQSGNLVFGFAGTPEAAGRALEARLAKDLGFPVGVIVRSRERLREIVARNPFLAKRGIDPAHLHVTFLSGIPDLEAAGFASDLFEGKDEVVLVGSEAYLHCPGGYGKTAFSNAFFERKLGRTATTRNWRTVTALLEMAVANT